MGTSKQYKTAENLSEKTKHSEYEPKFISVEEVLNTPSPNIWTDAFTKLNRSK